jgi:hypothetical protein
MADGCDLESRLERDECSAAASTPFPDTYRAEGLPPMLAIRDVLQKIRIEIRCTQCIKRRQKQSAEHRRSGVAFKTVFRPPGACHSCNTLLKRGGGSGESSAFSLCRGFG